ncbi:hypothetical protein TNCV_761421 [Trichonephila clavipes]|nr:hypothetical protein TNCV_761421 [Trichonephila clavipes]
MHRTIKHVYSKGKNVKRLDKALFSLMKFVRDSIRSTYFFGESQMNSLAASVNLTYSASMVDRLTDFCLKVRDEIGVSSTKVMNPPIDTRSSLFVAKSESE